VAWLASTQSGDISGRVIDAGNGRVAVAEMWRRGPELVKTDRLWDAEEVGEVLRDLVKKAAPNVNIMGYVPGQAS
jgi:hypothetical protein